MKTLNNILAATFIIICCNCKRGPYIAYYTNTGGYIIGNENCDTNAVNNYWLVDLTYYPNTPQYGDTLILGGSTYRNVVKVKGLDSRLKQIGMKVSFDFKTITPNKIVTNGCNVSIPLTYNLKELFIINQGEIR